MVTMHTVHTQLAAASRMQSPAEMHVRWQAPHNLRFMMKSM